MSKTLGGSLFIRNGEKFDYCYKQAIQCLLEFCDKVSVCVVPTDDDSGIPGIVQAAADVNGLDRVIIRVMHDIDWLRLDFQNKHRLSIFTNYAIEMLDTDYVFNLQGDEIVDPSSYEWIRKAIEIGHEGYLCKRINLWGSPYKQLNVSHYRKPCSTEIVRLAKACYRAYDDAESLAAPCNDGFLDQIKIWHYGFIRKKEVHCDKIRQMQADIFKITPDSKLEGMGNFDGSAWFGPDDLIPIEGNHPPLMQEWIKTRP